MAQSTYGITLGYGDAVDPRTEAPTYTLIPDITGIPSLGASPSTLDVTTLTDKSHKYIKGLMDVGGNLEFPCNFSDEILEAIDTAELAEEAGTAHEWAIMFPAPISKRAYFNGEVSIYNDSGDVDSALTGTVAITPTSVIEWEDIA